MIYRAVFIAMVVGGVIAAVLFNWQSKMVAGRPPELNAPAVSPRAQSEFESGEIFKAYRASSEKENEGLEQVFDWMVAHPREALK